MMQNGRKDAGTVFAPCNYLYDVNPLLNPILSTFAIHNPRYTATPNEDVTFVIVCRFLERCDFLSGGYVVSTNESSETSRDYWHAWEWREE